jgi:hypothetical protein
MAAQANGLDSQHCKQRNYTTLMIAMKDLSK